MRFRTRPSSATVGALGPRAGGQSGGTPRSSPRPSTLRGPRLGTWLRSCPRPHPFLWERFCSREHRCIMGSSSDARSIHPSSKLGGAGAAGTHLPHGPVGGSGPPGRTPHVPRHLHSSRWPNVSRCGLSPPPRAACSWSVGGPGRTPCRRNEPPRGLGQRSLTPGALSGAQVALPASVPSGPLERENAGFCIPGPRAAGESRGFPAPAPPTGAQASPCGNSLCPASGLAPGAKGAQSPD